MKYSRIDGNIFEKMMTNSLNYLRRYENHINQINVFPVPDGDTGSNLRMTLENGIKYADSLSHAGKYVKKLATGMLYGARGNSGVILSQIFYGLSEAFERKSILDAEELLDGFDNGIKCAYKAVRNPKEGTVLTVAREGAEALYGKITRGTDIEVFFSMYCAEMRKSLANTPEIMPILKEAGVVDSGAFGYIIIVEGMLKFLQNEIIDGDFAANVSTDTNINVSKSGKYGYCTEFILKLNDNAGFDLNSFSEALDDFGDSVVSVKQDDNIKVHIHTKKPGEIITYAQKFGEFVNVKIENMELQTKSFEIGKTKNKELVKIAFCEGNEACELLEELGCIVVRTLNPSAEEIADKISEACSENIAVITNNKNAIMSSWQAAKLSENVNIYIIETANILEGYYAAASDDLTSKNIDYRIKSMRDAKASINAFSVFPSAKDFNLNGVSANQGDFVTASDEEILESDESFVKAIVKTLENADLSECGTMIIMKGSSFPLTDDEMLSALSGYSNLEINILEGGFSINTALIGLL